MGVIFGEKGCFLLASSGIAEGFLVREGVGFGGGTGSVVSVTNSLLRGVGWGCGVTREGVSCSFWEGCCS